MISIKRNQSKDLIEIHIEKETSKSEFYKFCNFLINNKSISRTINLLFIIPEGMNKVDYVNLSNISFGLKEACSHFDQVNMAVSVCKNRECFLCSVFKKLISDSKIRFEYFPSTKDAVRWIRRVNYQPSFSNRYA